MHNPIFSGIKQKLHIMKPNTTVLLQATLTKSQNGHNHKWKNKNFYVLFRNRNPLLQCHNMMQ